MLAASPKAGASRRRFYETLGYSYAGGIPEYALDPDGTPARNAIYFKLLSRAAPTG